MQFEKKDVMISGQYQEIPAFSLGTAGGLLAAVRSLLLYMSGKSIPDKISVYEGQEAQLDDMLPSELFSYDEDIAVLGGNQYQLQCRLFGILPVKTVKVQSIPGKRFL